MKSIIKFLALIIAIHLFPPCKAQLMQTLNDAEKIQANKDYYIGKSFNILLRDIEPQIQSYIVHFNSDNEIDGIILAFIPHTEYLKKMTSSKAKPTTVGIIFQDIDSFNNIIKSRRGNWTQGISDSLSGLTIQRVYAYGSDINFNDKLLLKPKPPYTTRPDTVKALPNK